MNKLLKNVGGTNFLCVLLSVVLFIFNPVFLLGAFFEGFGFFGFVLLLAFFMRLTSKICSYPTGIICQVAF